MSTNDEYTININKSESQFYQEPYPHLVIHDALPETVHNEILKDITKFKDVISISDKTRSFHKEEVEKLGNFSSLSKVISAHLDKDFNKMIYDFFKPFFPKNTPLFRGELSDLVSSSSLVVNGILNKADTPRGPHIDNLKDLIVFLYYLKLPTDLSDDGNLVIYKYKTKFKGFDMIRVSDSHSIPPEHIVKVNEVQYKSNTAVIFLNGLNSIHGVSLRNEASSQYRFLVTGGLKSSSKCYDPISSLDFFPRIANYLSHIAYKIRNF